MSKIKVKLIKTGMNPNSHFATLQNDLTIVDSHPAVKIGREVLGYVNEYELIPIEGKRYFVSYSDTSAIDYKYFETTEVIKVVNPFMFMTKNSVYTIQYEASNGRLFSHNYSFSHNALHVFEFNKKNALVDLTNYKRLETDVIHLADHLIAKPDSRKALTILSDTSDVNSLSCLISLQYLVEEKLPALHCIANFRSQHAMYGYPHDTQMLNYLTTLFVDRFEKTTSKKFETKSINVNVADFHNYAI